MLVTTNGLLSYTGYWVMAMNNTCVDEFETED